MGVRPVTPRRWADEGRAAVRWVGRERRFDSTDLDVLIGQADQERPRREALYVRVPGTTGQESSLVAREAQPRATATAEVVAVFKDEASGPWEHRPGLDRLLKAAAGEEVRSCQVTS